jgi:hypothetical protein
VRVVQQQCSVLVTEACNQRRYSQHRRETRLGLIECFGAIQTTEWRLCDNAFSDETHLDDGAEEGGPTVHDLKEEERELAGAILECSKRRTDHAFGDYYRGRNRSCARRGWKEPKERIPLAVRQIHSPLKAHRPA